MTRNEFFKKLMQAGLLLILSLISLALGGKIVSGNSCTGCPSKSVCKGDSYCEILNNK
ncbi:MAG: hypothetical protein WAL29_09325 [Bacteroidales bacterium]